MNLKSTMEQGMGQTAKRYEADKTKHKKEPRITELFGKNFAEAKLLCKRQIRRSCRSSR